MDRKLINYLPYVVRDYAEFQGITGAEQPEFETAWAAADDLLANQFIKTAGNLGLPQLRVILGTLCGAGNYSAEVVEGTYQLIVKIGLAAKNNFSDVESLLDRVVPQNMVVNLLQLYNTHAGLGRFTHAQLAAHTHDRLRNEVMN